MNKKAEAVQPRAAGIGMNRALALGGVVLVLVLMAGAYLVLRQLSTPSPPSPPGGVGPSSTATPAMQQSTPEEYVPSPLIAEYEVTGTPVLVFNCNYLRKGTYATKERRFQVPEGTERQDLINELCSISGADSFCGFRRDTGIAGTLQTLDRAGCGSGAKVQAYAFYSPSCSNSEDQAPILDLLESDFSADLEVKRICTPIFDGDAERCKALVASHAYDE